MKNIFLKQVMFDLLSLNFLSNLSKIHKLDSIKDNNCCSSKKNPFIFTKFKFNTY